MLCRDKKKPVSSVLLQTMCGQCYRMKLWYKFFSQKWRLLLTDVFPLCSASWQCVGTPVSERTLARSLLCRLLYLTWHRFLCGTLKSLFPIIVKLIVLASFIGGREGGNCTELYDHMAFNNVPEITLVFKKKRNSSACI
jgi:hypothetical protein